MNIAEAIINAQKRCTPPVSEFVTGVLDATHGIDSLDATSIECLWIKHGYDGAVPELSLYPNLKEFNCSKTVSLEYLARQDFLSFEKLLINIDNSPATIRINAPLLKRLYLNIHNNDSDQIDMFSMGPKMIDLSLMPCLEEIELRHCTGYDIAINGTLTNLKKAIYSGCRYADFSHLRCMPYLVHLSITDCKVSNLGFLNYCKQVKCLDLSCNEIADASAVLTLPKLEKVNLYRNPLQNTEQLSHITYPSILSPHDADLDRYMWKLTLCANIAYLTTKRARIPDKKRPLFCQRIIDRSTDEELFAQNLEHLIWRDINQAIHGELRPPYKSLTPEEMLMQAVQEYPFIATGLTQCFDKEKNK